MVRVNGTISEAFSISSGVRQGCVLAANLFNTATDRILNNTTQALTLGVNYDDSGQLITDLDYADDVVIFADLFDTLREALFIFNEQSKKLGLHVNWSKTKLQSFSPWIPTPPSTLIGTQPVTTTDNFTYLGSTIASSNSSFNDVNRRIAIATYTMATLSSIWTSSRLLSAPYLIPPWIELPWAIIGDSVRIGLFIVGVYMSGKVCLESFYARQNCTTDNVTYLCILRSYMSTINHRQVREKLKIHKLI